MQIIFSQVRITFFTWQGSFLGLSVFISVLSLLCSLGVLVLVLHATGVSSLTYWPSVFIKPLGRPCLEFVFLATGVTSLEFCFQSRYLATGVTSLEFFCFKRLGRPRLNCF